MTTRLATADDTALLAVLHGQCFTEVWDQAAIASLLTSPGTFALVADDEAGFVMLRVAAGESEVLTLTVLPAARRRGIATSLLLNAARHALEQGATELFLEVDTTNLPAIALYKRLGFVQVGLRPNYYVGCEGQRHDAIVLRVEILQLRVGIPMQLG
jgi:ribosomal-protein-alanine N-acetyltransferase